jgi:hypothetical protein
LSLLAAFTSEVVDRLLRVNVECYKVKGSKAGTLCPLCSFSPFWPHFWTTRFPSGLFLLILFSLYPTVLFHLLSSPASF